MKRLKANAIEPGSADGKILKTQSGKAVWGDPSTPSVAFSALTDVDLTGLDNGEIPVWDAAAGKWKPGAPASTGGTAATTTFSPAGNIAAVNVQDAILELDSEKSPTGHTHSGLTVAGIYRGEYVVGAEGVLGTYDFSGGTIPAVLNPSGGYSVENYASISGGAITSPPTKQVRLTAPSGTQMFTTPAAVQSDLGISATVTKFRFWWAANSETTDVFRIYVAGGLVANKSGTSGGAGWSQMTTAAMASSDQVIWRYTKDGSFNVGTDSGYVARIEAIGNISTNYLVNDLVSYAGALWRCVVASTAAVPGANGDWALVPIGAKKLNAQTGTAYTLTINDGAAVITMSNAATSTLTVPPNSSVAFPIGTAVEVHRLGVGIVTLVAGSGVTLNSPGGLDLSAQFGTARLVKVATDTWEVTPINAPGSSGGSGGASPSLLASAQVTASTTYSNGGSTSLAAVDATNLKVTVTVPASGKVLIRLSGTGDCSGANGGTYGLLEGAATVAEQGVGTHAYGDHTVEFLLTGLTPGSVHTYAWAYKSNTSGQLMRIYTGGSAGVPGSALMTAADGGSAAPGGGQGTRYWVNLPSVLNSGTIPTTDTVIPGMTLTIPSDTAARTAFVDVQIMMDTGHSNRFSIYLDGVMVSPTLPAVNGGSGAGIGYWVSFTKFPITLAAGASRTIDVRWNAADSTAAMNFKSRVLVADVYAGTTSPIPI